MFPRPLTPALILAAALALLVGCSRRLKIADSAYAGPRIELRSPGSTAGGGPRDQVGRVAGGRKHVLAVLSPSSGWTVVFDREQRFFDRTDLYLTLRRPNPAELQTQAIVVQEIATTADASIPARVYARVLDFAQTASNQPYELAVRE